jgi:hypothetical protein
MLGKNRTGKGSGNGSCPFRVTRQLAGLEGGSPIERSPPPVDEQFDFLPERT